MIPWIPRTSPSMIFNRERPEPRAKSELPFLEAKSGPQGAAAFGETQQDTQTLVLPQNRNACDEATLSEDRLPFGPRVNSSASAVKAARLRARCRCLFPSRATSLPRASPHSRASSHLIVRSAKLRIGNEDSCHRARRAAARSGSPAFPGCQGSDDQAHGYFRPRN